MRDVGDQVLQYTSIPSHDGTRAALNILDQSQNNGDIWIHDLRRNIRTRLTFHEGQRFPTTS